MSLTRRGSSPQVTAIQLPGSVGAGAEPVLHCLGVKQAARVLWVEGGLDCEPLRQGGTRRLRFRFVYVAEFLLPGTPCILREGSLGVQDPSVCVGRISTVAMPMDNESSSAC